MLKQAARLFSALAVMAFVVPAIAAAQNPTDDVVPPSPLDIPQDAAGLQGPAANQAMPSAAAPSSAMPSSPWDYYLHDPYFGTPDRPYGEATTTYYPWPGRPYYGPRYYGFRPGWFGAGYPTSDFGGFWW